MSHDRAAPEPVGNLKRAATSARRKARKVRYHDHEWARIVAHAHACGMPAATFVRKVSLDAKPRALRSRTENELILRLSRIASALDKLVRLVGQTDGSAVPENLERALEETLAAVRRLG